MNNSNKSINNNFMENKKTNQKYPFDLYNIEEELASSNSSVPLFDPIDEVKMDVVKEAQNAEKLNNLNYEKQFEHKISFNALEETNLKQRAGSGIILRGDRGYSNFSRQPSRKYENDDDSSEEEEIDLIGEEEEIDIIKNVYQLDRTKSKVSFYEGRPKDEEEILKLECPLYRCNRNTIVSSKKLNRSTSIASEKAKIPSKSILKKQITKNSDNIRDSNLKGEKFKFSKKKTGQVVDIKLANTLELKTFNSLFMTILQIINCIIRYTIVQFPFCIKTLGLIYGPIVISIIGSMSIFSVYMLIKVRENTNEASYSAFAYKWWGLPGKIFILILNISSSFGSCLSYIIIFLKVIPKLVNIGIGDVFLSDKKLLSILLGVWLLIYCYQNDISGIKSAAFFGVLGIISYLILNIVNLFYSCWIEEIIEDKDYSFFVLSADLYDITSCIATIILSFSFHTYCFSIYECLDTPDQRKMIVTSSIGIFTSILIYLLVGTIGYILYGSHITDSILDSVGFSSFAVLENISFIMNVVMSFPLTFSALKHYTIFLVEILASLIIRSFKKNKKETLIEKPSIGGRTHTSSVPDKKTDDHDESINYNNNHHNNHLHMIHIPHWVEYILIFLLFLTIFFTANTYPDMKIIFGFLGANTANIFSFILPALYFIKFSNHNVCNIKNLLPFLFILIGLVGLVLCNTANIMALIHGKAH